MTRSDDPRGPNADSNGARPDDADPKNHRPSSPPVGFNASVSPAATDATLVGRLRALIDCRHPTECVSRATVLDSHDSRIRMQWCGACGAIGIVDGVLMPWRRPGLPRTIETEALDRWQREMDALQRAAAEVTNHVRMLASELGTRAQELHVGLSELERAAAAALAAFRR